MGSWKDIPYKQIIDFVPPYCDVPLGKLSNKDLCRLVALYSDIIGRMVEDRKKSNPE